MAVKKSVSQFQRGFKSWCENIALQYRKEMKLQPIDPIDPIVLAQKLAVTVWMPEEIPGLAPETLQVLTKDDPDSWSAMTLCVGEKNLIVLNSAHPPGRISSSLAHELSHIIIGHKAVRIDVTDDNLLILRNYDKKQEVEADWLAGCLLLPREAILHIRRKRMDTSLVLKTYHVSNPMFEYRVRITGVDRQLGKT